MYYLIDIETYNNGTADSKAIYAYASESEAVASFHSRIGSAMKNATCRSVLCKVISETGTEVKSEFWARPEV